MKKRNGFLTTVLGTLLSIAAAVIFTLIMSFSSRLIFSVRFGDRPVMALLSNSVAYIFVAFIIYEVVFFVWLFCKMSDEKRKEAGGKGLKKPVLIAALAALIISVCMIIANSAVYTEISEDSITDRSLFSEKKYTIEDVYRYSLSCDSEGTLKYTIWTDDGNSFELFEGANTRSEEFTAKYGDGLIHFASVLSDKFDSSEVYIEKVISESTLTYLERYYSQGDSVWEDILKIIQ